MPSTAIAAESDERLTFTKASDTDAVSAGLPLPAAAVDLRWATESTVATAPAEPGTLAHASVSTRLTGSGHFSYATAAFAASVSQLAYAAPAEIGTQLRDTGWAPLSSAHPAYVTLDQGTFTNSNAFAFAATRQSGNQSTFVIGFRGSDDPGPGPDWYRNNLRAYGFTGYYRDLRPIVEEAVWQALQRIQAGQNVELIVTGHSLGGAAVQAALLDILLPHGRGVWPASGSTIALQTGDRLGESATATAAYSFGSWYGTPAWTRLLSSITAYTFGAPQLVKDVDVAGQSLLDIGAWRTALGNDNLSWLSGRLFQFEHADSSLFGRGDLVPLFGLLPFIDPLGNVVDVDLSPGVSAEYLDKRGLSPPFPFELHDMQLYRESVLRAITDTELVKPGTANDADSPLLLLASGGTGTSGNDFIGSPAGATTQGLAGNDVIKVSAPGAYTVDGGTGRDVYVLASDSVQLTLVGDTRDDTLLMFGSLPPSYAHFDFDSPTLRLTTTPLGLVGSTVTFADAFTGLGGYAVNAIATTNSQSSQSWTLAYFDLPTLGLPYFMPGTSANDALTGGAGVDLILGLEGNDTLRGNAGNDLLHGGPGADSLWGGTGADVFAIAELPDSAGADDILDYSLTEGDLVDLSRLLGAAFAAGQKAEALVRALPGNGIALLQVDVDGTAGPATWQTVAQLAGGLALPSIGVVLQPGGRTADYATPIARPVSGVSVAPDNITVDEGAGTWSFTVSRVDTSSAQTLYVSTVFYPGMATAADVQAVTDRAVNFAAGQLVSNPITLAVIDDGVIEFAEAFGVVIQSAPGLAVDDRLGTMLVVIQDNEPVPLNTSGGPGDDWVRLVPPATGGVGVSMGGGIDRAIFDFRNFGRPIVDTTDSAFPRYRLIEGTDSNNPALTRAVAEEVELVMVQVGSGGSNIRGLGGNDVLIGGSGTDQLYGGGLMLGGGGNDILRGWGVVDGGPGDDFIVSGRGGTYFGGSGKDFAQISGGAETRPMRLYVDLSPEQSIPIVLPDGTTLSGFEQILLLGGFGDDQMWLVGLSQGTLASEWFAGAGYDTLVVDLRRSPGQVASRFGNDAVTVSASFSGPFTASSIERFMLFAGSGNDDLRGTPNSDLLSGYAGNDTLYGSAGYDTLLGGDGADVLYDEGQPGYYDGGPGRDVISVDRTAATLSFQLSLDLTLGGSRSFDLVDGTAVRDIEGVTLRTGAGNDRVTLVADPALTHDLRAEVLRWDAGAGRDELVLDMSSSGMPLNYGYSGVLATYLNGGVTSGYYFVSLSTASIEKLTVFAGSGSDSFSLTETATEYVLDGGGGRDSFTGGFGNNRFTGGPGADYFSYSYGSTWRQIGVDTITDLAAEDRIYVDRGYLPGGTIMPGSGAAVSNRNVEVTTGSESTDLWFDTDSSPSAEVHIRLVGRFEAGQFAFSAVNQTEFRLLDNRAPTVRTPQPDLPLVAEAAFSLTVPTGTFADADGGRLIVSATRADGSALPGWLRFDTRGGTFIGLPQARDVGVLGLRLRATDSQGATVDDPFQLIVAPQGFNALNYIASYADLRSAYGTNELAATRHFVTTGGRSVTFDPLRYIAAYADLIATFGTDTRAAAIQYITTGAAQGRNDRFDGSAYWAMNADARSAAGTNATALAAHYITHGYGHGAATTLDGLRYIASHGDLVVSLGANAAAGRAHFVANGFAEGRAVTFDPLAYIASYQDLMAAFGTNAAAGTAHYITRGFAEGRHVSFEPLAYAAGYADLTAAFGANAAAAAAHYIQSGFSEGRQNQFDYRAYWAMNAEARVVGTTAEALARHYLARGAAQGLSAQFDALRYTASYGDLIGTFGLDATAARAHFAQAGFSEGRTVSFDAWRYIAGSADLIAAFGADTVGATRHYIEHGFAEGRNLSFDGWQYLMAHGDLRAAFGNDAAAAERHYVLAGYAEGRATRLIPLDGTSGDDMLRGGSASEAIRGGAGADRIDGGGGSDLITGGLGADWLSGGGGADVFFFAMSAEGGDLIDDFTSGSDVLLFGAGGFAGLAPGALDASRLASSSAALGSGAGFVYDAASGSLAFDPDGSGPMAATPIAGLGAGRALAPTDILIGG